MYIDEQSGDCNARRSPENVNSAGRACRITDNPRTLRMSLLPWSPAETAHLDEVPRQAESALPAPWTPFQALVSIALFERRLRNARPVTLGLLFIVCLSVAELTTTFISPLLGIVAHVLLLMATVVASSRVLEARTMVFIMPLMLMPLIRIVSMGLPLNSFSRPWWFLLPGLAILAGILIVMQALDIHPRRVGLNLPAPRHIPLTLAVAASGMPIGGLEYVILQPEGISKHDVPSLVFATFAVAIGSGLMEELLFRGVLLATALVVFRVAPAILFTSLLFAVMHIGNQSMADILLVFAVGVFYAAVAYRTQSIIGVVLSHSVTNVVVFIALPMLHLSNDF